MLKVVIISKKDFSGSASKLVEALRKTGEVDVKLITKGRSRYKHEVDYCLESTNVRFVQEVVNRADVIHFKGDDVPVNNWNGIDTRYKPRILTVAGSYARRHGDLTEGVSLNICDLEQYVNKSDIRTAFTADLNYPDYKGIFTPQCINDSEYLFNYTGKHIIQHSPSCRNKKGTDKYIFPAIQILRERGYDFEFELLENLTNEECCERKKRGTLFIDQVCSVGWYGISALESMRYGIPTLAHLSTDAIRQSGLKEIGVINTDLNIRALADTIESYLKLKKADVIKKSKETFDYFTATHGYKACSEQWIKIYTDALTVDITRPKEVIIDKWDIDELSDFVMVEWLQSLGDNQPHDIDSMPKCDALELQKKHYLKIIKASDMIKVKILKQCFAEGALRLPGELCEVSHNKSKSLINQGHAILTEQLPEQAAPVAEEQTASVEAEVINEQLTGVDNGEEPATVEEVKKVRKPRKKKQL
jgi:glycosyltransferase involved in cell wall biosynthesis